jgi:hypothetical protein
VTDASKLPDDLTPLPASRHAAGPSPVRAAELHRAYSRSLRWYPSAWRSRNGQALVAALMDQADAEGRRAPRASEVVWLAITGIAERTRGVFFVLPLLALPVAGVSFSILWIVAEAGRWYPGSSPVHVAAVAIALGSAIAVARLSPPVAWVIVSAVLVTQVVWGGVRLGDTAWPMYGSVLVIVASAAASPSVRTRRIALVLAIVAGTALGSLLVLPIPSIGPAVPAAFSSALVDAPPLESIVVMSAVVCGSVATVVATWAGGVLLRARVSTRSFGPRPLVRGVH